MIEDTIAWIEATSIGATLRAQEWIVPTLQTLHILLVAAVFGASVLLALRVLRRQEGHAALLRVIWVALPGLLLTGLLLIVAEPARTLGNPAFNVKLALLLLVSILTFALSRGVARGVSGPITRAIATASILVWSGIAVAGRWVAYVGEG